jgi:hypothetical protein
MLNLIHRFFFFHCEQFVDVVPYVRLIQDSTRFSCMEFITTTDSSELIINDKFSVPRRNTLFHFILYYCGDALNK